MRSCLFKRCFGTCRLVRIDSALLHQDRNHTGACGDVLAFGETDIEVIATLELPDKGETRVALLVEDKVDARQAEDQGQRYQARARYRQTLEEWSDFRCILVAPQAYLESAYPLGDHRDHGWDRVVSFEEIASVVEKEQPNSPAGAVLRQATEPSNAWNRSDVSAAQYWKDLRLFQRAFHPDVTDLRGPTEGRSDQRMAIVL